MRLTLRTMLAYMDEILEPEDARELGTKIDESKTASELLIRTRDVMRRLRLGAPNVGERGAMLDPNTVAEYLDNTLSGGRVPDFEKVCLESDVHLAEVASCHQILTLVLGEPAEVDPASRQRMYQLPELAAAQVQAAGEPAGDGKGEASPEKAAPPPRPKPTVPDYLRDTPKKRRFWPAAAALFLAGFFAVVVLAAMGQFGPGTPLGNLLGLEAQDRDVARVSDEQPEQPLEGPDEPAAKLEQPGVAEPKPAIEDPPGPLDPLAEKPPLPEDVKPLPEEKPAPGPDVPAVTPPAKKPALEQPVTGPIIEPKPEPGPGVDPAKPKPDTVDPIVEPGMEKPGVAVAESPRPKESEAPPVPAEVLGRLVSPREVLLRQDPKDSHWERVPDQASISAGRRLLALPTYRPMIALTAAVTLQLTGGTQVELSPADASGVAGIKIVYGRIVLQSVGKAGTPLRIEVGGRTGILTLTDPESRVAIAARRTHAPGADPETQPDPVAVSLYATSGRVGWTPAGGQAVVVESIGMLALDAQPLQPVAVEKLPTWITSDTVNPLDRRASGTMGTALTTDRAIRLGLKELADHRQREVRWLAVRCLGYMGDFQRLVAALNNPDDRLVWPDHIECLQEALSRGPETAAAVRRTMEDQFAQEGTGLYRMLYGYTNDGLRSGDAARLVGYLEHPDLVFRVLGSWNLKNITGWGLFYEPEAPEAKRKQSVRKWQERLESGALLRSKEEPKPAKPAPKTPPSPSPRTKETP